MKLRDYLEERGISMRKAALELDIDHSTISRWLTNGHGRRWPNSAHMRLVHEWSGGRVTPNDFFEE